MLPPIPSGLVSPSSAHPLPERDRLPVSRPLGFFLHQSCRLYSHHDSIRKMCPGNMIPVWNFLLERVKSEKTVDNIRRDILVHGGSSGVENVGKKNSVPGLVEKESSRDIALQERELAEKEVERLRQRVWRQRKELKARMLEASREEAECKSMLDERSNYRHKQVMPEAYDQQCDEATTTFAEHHKRLRYYVNQARDLQRSSIDPVEVVISFHTKNKKEAMYLSVKGSNLNLWRMSFLLKQTRKEIYAGHGECHFY